MRIFAYLKEKDKKLPLGFEAQSQIKWARKA